MTNLELRGKKLGDVLIAMGVIEVWQLEAGLRHANEWDHPLGASLVALGFCTEEAVVRARSVKFGIPSIRLAGIELAPSVRNVIETQMAHELQILPLTIQNRKGRAILQVAMSNPEDLDRINAIEFSTGLRVEVILAGDNDLAAAIQRIYGENFDHLPMMNDHFLPSMEEVWHSEHGMDEPTLDLAPLLDVVMNEEPTQD